MNVNFYTFAKKYNSTKLPSTAATSLNMTLKDPTSVLNPVLTISPTSLGSLTNPTSYNYAYIQAFNRRYFVTDWVYINGLWEVHLKVDVLGSFKTAIGTSSCYIDRAASQYDGSISDFAYSTKTDVSITKTSIPTPWRTTSPSGGTYVVGIINNSSNRVGAISYYACTQSVLSQFLAWLFSGDIYTAGNIQDVSENMFKAIFNPFQYIVSCTWFPFDTETFGTSTEVIKVGYWVSGIEAVKVISLASNGDISITIPSHPQAATRGTYLNYSPYTKITIYIEPFGIIQVDNNFRSQGDLFRARYYIDHITGMGTIYPAITAINDVDPYKYMGLYHGNFGVPIQLAQVMTTYEFSMGGVMDAVVDGAAQIAKLIADKIEPGTATAFGGYYGLHNKVTTSGSNGSFLYVVPPAYMITEHLILAEENLSDIGRPLRQTKTINTLAGFVKCINPEIATSCTHDEEIEIRKFMEDGFFYE